MVSGTPRIGSVISPQEIVVMAGLEKKSATLGGIFGLHGLWFWFNKAGMHPMLPKADSSERGDTHMRCLPCLPLNTFPFIHKPKMEEIVHRLLTNSDLSRSKPKCVPPGASVNDEKRRKVRSPRIHGIYIPQYRCLVVLMSQECLDLFPSSKLQ